MMVTARSLIRVQVHYEQWCKNANENDEESFIVTEELDYVPNLKANHHCCAYQIENANSQQPTL